MKDMLTDKKIISLIHRMELMPSIVNRYIEEEIINLVSLPKTWHDNALKEFLEGEKLSKDDLNSWLEKKCWNIDDLTLHLARPEALYRFSKQRFGPGLEEKFLANAKDLDDVIYSLIRVKDPFLANELWMRLCEREVSFVDLAANYGEGPEAQRKGLIGPISFGSLQPSMIQDLLRGLSPGEFTPPTQLGEWHILIRLEQISPSSFDSKTRDKLLSDQLSAFIKDRSITLLNGEQLEPLHYDPES